MEILLRHLRERGNRWSRVIASERSLLEKLGVSRSALEHELKNLVNAGLVEVVSPLPFLVLKQRSWSCSNPPRDQKEQQGSSVRTSVIEEPVSSSIAAAAKQQEDGGAGEGEALLDETLAVLGPEADPMEFRSLLAGRQPALIHRALRRVKATKHIRVSRPALFRSLLQRLSN